MIPGAPALMSKALSPQRWQRLMVAWELPASLETLNSLQGAYREPQRHYHTAAHINACLAILDAHRELAHDFRVVELALWFHDAVYDPRASDNEARSAQWCVELLKLHGVSSRDVDAVERAILATRHTSEPAGEDDALVVDIDLAILGADADTYAAFEDGIRAEYLWVPIDVFRARRTEILGGFLARPVIYHHEPIRRVREARARENVGAAVARLRGTS